MTTAQDVLETLKAEARPDQLEGTARYGMTTEKRSGIPVPLMRKIAKEIGKNHELAPDLWKSGIAEAQIAASMIDEAETVLGSGSGRRDRKRIFR